MEVRVTKFISLKMSICTFCVTSEKHIRRGYLQESSVGQS